MKPIAALALLAGLVSADLAVAAVAKPAPRHASRPATGARAHKATLVKHRRKLRRHPVTTTVGLHAQASSEARTYRARLDDQGAPATGGFFKSERDKQAGWGMKNGSAETVLGVYQRPPDPGIPGPQIYSKPEGRGAAGLSLSFKLGH